MQRILNNLVTVAVIGLVSTSASLVMAKGGGGHGGGHSGHSSGHKSSHSHSHGSSHHGSHKGTGHKSSHSRSHSHSRSRSTNHHTTHNHSHNNFVSIRGNGNPPGHLPGYPPINLPMNPPWHLNPDPPSWHCHWHWHYPVRFWFDGGYNVVSSSVVATDAPVAGIDVEFTKIEQLDAGDPTKNIAPTYRVSFHNNSDVDIAQPFDVAILAANDDKLVEGLPSSSVRVDSLAADETTSVDIQLPAAAMTMGTTDGQTAAFSYVHTIIDSQKELVETNKANNLSVDSRDDIPAVADDQQAE